MEQPMEENCIHSDHPKILSELTSLLKNGDRAEDTKSCTKLDEINGIVPTYQVARIEDTVNLQQHQNYVDRFFTRKYCINVTEAYNDFCVLIHSNKVCALTLAPSHPLLKEDIVVKTIDFQISKNVNRLENKYSGKRKRHAQQLLRESVICFVECADGRRFTIYSLIPGRLLEINEQLANSPQSIQLCSPDNYHKQCFIALILPYFKQPMDDLNKDFLASEEYEKEIRNRS